MSLSIGMDANDVRQFLAQRFAERTGATSFYWDNPESEEVIELVIELLADLVPANNERLERDAVRKAALALRR